jgi:hypothetical protein
VTEDDLYGLPLAEFVAARNALAKELRAAGKRDDAAAVAALPKPSAAAWAANQVLRSQPRDARELFDAGEELTAATGDALRGAIARHRDVLGRLVAAAEGLLDSDGRGLSGQSLERVGQTLNAVSLDPDLRDEGRAGRLTKEHFFSGVGIGPKPAKKAKARTPKAKPKPKPKPDKRHAKAVSAAEKKVKEAREALEAAEAELARLRAKQPPPGA